MDKTETDYTEAYEWVCEALPDNFDDQFKELHETCTDPNLGRFIAYFGEDVMESVLLATNSQLENDYPHMKQPFPLSQSERYQLCELLSAHDLECESCMGIEVEQYKQYASAAELTVLARAERAKSEPPGLPLDE